MRGPVRTIDERAAAFKALHQHGIFIIPNPWDSGTARILESLGYTALATTSAGHAFSRGKADNTLTREETLAHARELMDATNLPLSADLGNCFGDTPDAVAETIRLAAEAGLAGASVEDATGRTADPIYEFGLAVERVRAAAAATRGRQRPFTLTARAENLLAGREDLPDTIARLQAFQEAGADVLYAPGLTRIEDVRTVVRSVDRPVNVLSGLSGTRFTLSELADAGVRRVSTGSALSRAALGAFVRAALEMRDHGTFRFVEDAAAAAEIAAWLA